MENNEKNMVPETEEMRDYKEKEAAIKKEERRLKRLFAKIDDSKKKLAFSTIADVAFLTVIMQELREKILKEGTTCEYKNGENQYGTKQSPDAQLYLQMSQKQTAAMKILMDCLPKTERPEPKDDGFDGFVEERDG